MHFLHFYLLEALSYKIELINGLGHDWEPHFRSTIYIILF